MKVLVLSISIILLLMSMLFMGCATTVHSTKEKKATEISVLEKNDTIISEKVFFPSAYEKEILIPATYYRPSSIPEDDLPGVILIHGAFGIRGYEYYYIKRFCDLGYIVLLPDFFSPRRISHTSIAAGLNQKKSFEYTRKIITDIFGAKKYLENQGKKASEIVLFGWSVGGTYALWAASIYEKNIGAAIAYYSPCNFVLSVITRTQVPLLLIQAEYDDWPYSREKDCIPQFKMLQKLNLPIEFHIVKGAYHCFDNSKAPIFPSTLYGCTIEYSARATEEAWKVSIDFLERKFMQKRRR